MRIRVVPAGVEVWTTRHSIVCFQRGPFKSRQIVRIKIPGTAELVNESQHTSCHMYTWRSRDLSHEPFYDYDYKNGHINLVTVVRQNINCSWVWRQKRSENPYLWRVRQPTNTSQNALKADRVEEGSHSRWCHITARTYQVRDYTSNIGGGLVHK